MKHYRFLRLSLLLGLVLCAWASPAAAQSRDLFNNTNIFGVNNGPTRSTQFTLNAPARITQLVTYHWNNRRGATPGMIALANQRGQIVAQFAAIGTPGFGGVQNANWVANGNVILPAGSYTVLDSDRNTWSNNAQSGFQGFAIVRGSLVSQPPPAPPAPVDRGSNSRFTPTILIPVSSMPRVAPNLLQQTVSDGIGGSDTNDWYTITVTGPNGSQQPRGVLFVIGGFSGNVQLELYTQTGAAPFLTGGPPGSAQKSISRTLAPGTYLVNVRWTGAPTSYTLTISANAF
jgi:hypothetical protein